jgi:hypothetical protein
MSDLQPKGIPVRLLDGVERSFLFTLACVDEVQDHFDKPVNEVMAMLADERESYRTLAFLAMTLANDELKRKGEEKLLTLDEVKWLITVPSSGEVTRAVMKAYGFGMPEPDEDDDPN